MASAVMGKREARLARRRGVYRLSRSSKPRGRKYGSGKVTRKWRLWATVLSFSAFFRVVPSRWERRPCFGAWGLVPSGQWEARTSAGVLFFLHPCWQSGFLRDCHHRHTTAHGDAIVESISLLITVTISSRPSEVPSRST